MQHVALVNGSESFGRYLFNPSKLLALAVDGKTIADHNIHSLVFPTVVRLPTEAEDQGETIVKKAIEIKADVILSFGLASEAKGFRFERSATNWIDNVRYCLPYENDHPIDSKHPSMEQIHHDLSPWNFTLIKRRFVQAGVPFDPKISDDPGQFSCNSWIYRTYYALKKYKLAIPYAFIHLPCMEETIQFIPDFPRDKKLVISPSQILKGFEILLSCYMPS